MSATTSESSSQGAGLTKYVPILSWARSYDRSWLSGDVIAGLTLWGLVVPAGMAYSGIAGLPPQAGLYTLLASMLIYALLGTSRHLAVAATSASAALLASSVASVMEATGARPSDADAYAAYAVAFILVTGLVFLAAGLARLGFITQFLSKPVMDGFVVGLATFVAVGQLYKLFGVEKVEGNTVEKFFGVIQELPDANWVTFLIGASALALLFLLPRLNKKIPGGLIVLFAAIILSVALGLEDNYGVEVVGELPQGLPSIALPQGVPFYAYVLMIVPAIGALLVSFSESLGVAHEFAEKHGYEVDADQELNAAALVNLGSALVGGLVAGGSMSQSAVKEGAGARSQVANLVTWVAVILTLLFLTPLFAPLPEAVLGALIIHAVWHLIVSRKLQKIRQASRVEFWFGLLTMLGVLFVDVLQGMIIGMVASVLFVIYQTSKPHIARLGRVPDAPGAFTDLARHPDNVPVPGVLVARIDTQIYYANALTVRDALKTMIAETDPPPRILIVDAAAQEEMDVTSTDMLRGLLKELRAKGIALYVAEVHEPLQEHARETGFMDAIGEDHMFLTLDSAVKAAEAALGQSDAAPALDAEPDAG
jgi:high affinity sulfate transporter 1